MYIFVLYKLFPERPARVLELKKKTHFARNMTCACVLYILYIYISLYKCHTHVISSYRNGNIIINVLTATAAVKRSN